MIFIAMFYFIYFETCNFTKFYVVLYFFLGANPLKKETALHNMSILMDSAHAVRCPGMCYDFKI